jgi:glycosyltransferase involved in cell wall biosynthesis
MTSPKRPLHILVFSAKGGGTGCALRARYIAEAFQKKGHRVTFVTPLPSLPLWFDMALSAPYYFLRSLFTHSDAAIAIKPYPTVVPSLWVQRLKGSQLVIDVDDLDFDYSHGLFRTFHQWLQKPWPAWADIVTYHNPALLGPLREFFKVPPSKLVQLAQGVDTSLFRPGKPRFQDLPTAALELQRQKDRGPLLAFTAHLNVACDLEPVLESLKFLLRYNPKVQLLVAGGGPDESRFKRLAQELGISGCVHFTGMVTPNEVAACLQLSDAALVYYRDIPVNRHRASMKLREALACGLKVVVTRVGEASSLKSAVFLSQPDPKAFSKAIRGALRAKKSPQSGALLVKNWDWKRCIEPLEKALSQG